MKSRFSLARAFTLAETMVATAVFGMVGAVICLTTSSLIKNFAFTEDYSTAQSAMNRVLDYLSMDLRSAEAIRFNDVVFTTGTNTLGLGQTLVINRPAFYATEAESDLAALPLIAAGRGVVYGTSTSLGTPQKVTYTRIQTPAGEDVITRNGEPIAVLATNLTIRITATSNGREFQLNAAYFSNHRKSTTAQIRSDVQVMVRNPRTDI